MTVVDEAPRGADGPAAEVDADGVFTAWFARFVPALVNRDREALAAQLSADPWWRDMVALDWQMATHRGHADITGFVAGSPGAVLAAEIDREFGPLHTTPAPGVEWVEGFYRFTTPVLRGRGHVRLVRDADGEWRAWTVLTEGAELTARPLPVRHNRPVPSGDASEEPWHRRRARSTGLDRPDPEVVVVGGAQNGLGSPRRWA